MRFRSLAAVLVFIAGGACAPLKDPPVPCHDCEAGNGAVSISFALVPADIATATATVTGTGIPTPIVVQLTVGGTPRTITGTIPNVPAGTNRTIRVDCFPIGDDSAVVIARGSATSDVTAGQIAQVAITVKGVVGDVAVTATFPTGDTDVARIDHTAVTVTGSRIGGISTWYLGVAGSPALGTGTAEKIPVGSGRVVEVQSYDASNTLLHSGTATILVTEASSTAQVTMINATGRGAAAVDGSFCEPDCTGRVCGDDGCGASCGGCRPGTVCVDGQCPAASPTWSQPTVSGTPPSKREGTCSFFDAAQQTMILVDGTDASGDLNEVWALSTPATSGAWTKLTTSGTAPSARGRSMCAWDATARRAVLFGGGYNNDVWGLSFASGTPTWEHFSPSGTPPSWRGDASVAWDSQGSRLIVYGGGEWATQYNEVWALSVTGSTSSWTQLSPNGTSPAARSGAAHAWDDVNRRLILFGGADGGANLYGDAWVLSLNETPTWQTLTATGTPPGARVNARAAWDAPHSRPVVFSGASALGQSPTPYYSDVWTLSLNGSTGTWNQVMPSGTTPQGREFEAFAWDGADNEILVFGGQRYASSGTTLLNDLWALHF